MYDAIQLRESIERSMAMTQRLPEDRRKAVRLTLTRLGDRLGLLELDWPVPTLLSRNILCIEANLLDRLNR